MPAWLPDWETLKYVIEWFVAPLGMFLFLFKWRDELNILHMPWADLVSIFVVADVALALNYDRAPKFFWDLHQYRSQYNGDAAAWLLLAAGAFAICRLQVKVFEEDIEKIAIKQVSVGWRHVSPYSEAKALSIGEAIKSGAWWRFTMLWSTSVAVTALVIAVHSVVIGMEILNFGAVSSVVNELLHVLAITALSLVGAIALCMLFVLTSLCRVYPEPATASR